ncbi:MAG: hypothetical protein J2P13_07260, partial [Acidobacteria bacterium]|nr:hypothetical protein [Acidobacteriota bacterium]
AERARTAIQSGLGAIGDPGTGRTAIRDVRRREELYSGPYQGAAPDLLVNFSPGFRVSWQSAVGGFASSLFADNTRAWSGDHIVDPEAVPGILFMNQTPRPFAGDGRSAQPGRNRAAAIVDLAPTILDYLGAPRPETMEGSSLFSK